MQDDNDIFIGLLSAYVNRKNITFEEEVNWGNIYHLATIHNVQGIISTVVNSNALQLPDKINDQLQKSFYTSLVYSIKQEKEAEKLRSILNKHCIKHVMTKGYIVRNYYPDKELRTMGDVDILVFEDDFELVRKVLIENDYKLTDTYFNEVSFDKNNVHFEIHDSLLEEDLGNGYDYDNYFKLLCKKALKKENYTYELSIDDHLIYLIAHIGKHFYNEGCGIRMIMDIAVYVSKFKDELNWNYLWNEFENIKLKKFAENIFYICNRWFETKLEVSDMDKRLYEEVKKYILEAGTYGFYKRNNGIKLLRKTYGSGQQGSIFAWLFPNDKDMRKLNNWYVNKSIIFLPIAWVNRWLNSFSNKGWGVVTKLFGIINGKNVAEKQYVLLRELGIYQNKN